MIVLIIYQYGVVAFKAEGQPPVSVNPDRPVPFVIAREAMQTPARQIHICSTSCGIQPAQLQAQAFCMLGLNARFRFCPEKPFNTFMTKSPDHTGLYRYEIQLSSRCPDAPRRSLCYCVDPD